jgi:hypothetical protein
VFEHRLGQEGREMHSPPSKSRLTVRRSTSKSSAARVLEADEISKLEEIHSLLLDAYVFVSVAAELDHDKRWGDRMSVLIPRANKRLNEADEHIRDLVQLAYRRRRREAKKSA